MIVMYYILLLSWVGVTACYICHHDPLASDEVSFGHVEGKNEVNPSLINLVFHLDQTFTDKQLDSVVTESILSKVKQWFNSKVFVKIPSQTLHLARSCPGSGNGYSHCTGQCADVSSCGTATIPDSHLGKCYVCISDGQRCGFSVGTTVGAGVSGDVIIYLTSRDVAQCNVDTVQASACQLSPHDNRPIAGYFNLCPSFTDSAGDVENIVNILKHQLFHILGVSKVLYPYYMAPDGTPLSARDDNGVPKDITSTPSISETTIQWSNIDGVSSVSQKVLVGEKSSEEVKKYYGCENPEGLLLENQDPHYSHIEERIARGEGMTVNITTDSVFSKLSFSWLDDTGWYITGDLVEPVFGADLGCDFLSMSCEMWVERGRQRFENFYPFCDTTNAMSCDSQYRNVVQCQSKAYSIGAIPALYQYNSQQAGDMVLGGESVYSDYCMSFEQASTCNTTSDSIFLEKFGAQSVCMRHEGPWIRHGASHDHGAGCYEVCCRDDSYDVMSASNQVHSCYHNKQTIHLSSSDKNTRGSLTCAPLDKICTKDSKTCPSPGKCETPPMINGQVYGSQGMYQITIGTTLSFVCFDGYIMRGRSSTVCLGNNRYSATIPECKIKCSLPEVPHSTFDYSSSQTLLGDTITVQCASDYTLNGASVLKCSQGHAQSGVWSPELPLCVQQYLAWAEWGPCSGQCGQDGMQIRTRGCSTCKDFEWEEKDCTGTTCNSATGTDHSNQNRSDLLIFGIFAGIVILLMLVVVLVIAYVNYKNNQTIQAHRARSVFNESFYSVKKSVSKGPAEFKRNLSDLGSNYSTASGSTRQLFSTQSPPTSPFYVDSRQRSKMTLAAIQTREDPVIEIKYKEPARVLPRSRANNEAVPRGSTNNEVSNEVPRSVEDQRSYRRWKSEPAQNQIEEEEVHPPSYEDAFVNAAFHNSVQDSGEFHNAVQDSTEERAFHINGGNDHIVEERVRRARAEERRAPEERMRESIRAAKQKLQNNRSLKRLCSIHEGKIMNKVEPSVSDVESPDSVKDTDPIPSVAVPSSDDSSPLDSPADDEVFDSVLAAKTVLQELELPDPNGFPTNGGIIAEIQLPDVMNYRRTESTQRRSSLKSEGKKKDKVRSEDPKLDSPKSEKREILAEIQLPDMNASNNSMKAERSQKANTRHNPILAEIQLPENSQAPQEDDFVIISSPISEVAEVGKKQGLPPLKKCLSTPVITGLVEEGRLFTPLEEDEHED